MPWNQPYLDPNTGGTYPNTLIVDQVTGLDAANNIITISYQRFVSSTAYSLGFRALQTVGTQISGATYMSVFASPVSRAQGILNTALNAAAGSYLTASPEFSGAVFF